MVNNERMNELLVEANEAMQSPEVFEFLTHIRNIYFHDVANWNEDGTSDPDELFAYLAFVSASFVNTIVCGCYDTDSMSKETHIAGVDKLRFFMNVAMANAIESIETDRVSTTTLIKDEETGEVDVIPKTVQ